ncbi:MAG: L,D-transpeptidase [Bryobacteraceae bacterium]
MVLELCFLLIVNVQPVAYSIEKPAIMQNRLRADQVALLEKLNRADRRHLARQRELVVPSRWDLDELEYSPLPIDYPWAERYGKVLVVHVPSQVFGAYENGRLTRWGPVSTGKASTQTPAGLYRLNWKSEGRHSSVNPSWYMPWYFNFHARVGMALHQYSLPGHPASHACVRMLERDARWLYAWGEEWRKGEDGELIEHGTPVLILGHYPFGEKPVWRSKEWLGKRIALPARPFSELTEWT